MIFLQPWVLWALFALLIPIIVHLFNFQKPKKILFSNILLLKEVDKVITQRIKLKQWLLLVSRLMALAFLVLSFAMPVLKNQSSGTISSGQKSVVIIIDNSLSMSASNPKGVYLEQAKMIAREIVKSYESIDEFQIQTTGKLKMSSGFLRSQEALQKISEIQYHQSEISQKKLFEIIPLLFQNSSNLHRSVYVISDFQKSTFLKETQENQIQGINIQFVPIASQTFKNVFIYDISPETHIFEANRPITLKFKIRNLSDEKIPKLSIQTEVEGKMVAVSSESLEPQQIKESSVTFNVTETGWQSGRFILEDYPIEFDNQRFFSFYIPQKNQLLIVQGNEKSNYLKTLISEVLTSFEVTTIIPGELGNAQFQQYQTVIFAGVNEIPAGTAYQLSEWVKQGGGLLVFPSEDMKIADYQNFYQTCNLGKWQNLQKLSEGIEMENPNVDLAFYKDVFLPKPKNAKFDSPIVKKYYEFQPNPKTLSQNVLTLKNHHPFLAESMYGSGLVYTFASFPSLQWSDWVIKSIFVPVVYKSILLSANVSRGLNMKIIGDPNPITLRSPLKSLIQLKKISTEQKTELIPEQYQKSGTISLQFGKLPIEQGNYELIQEDSVLSKISFNINTLESELLHAGNEELSKYSNVIDANLNILRKSIGEAEEGTPLWKWFLMFALLMLIAELLILKFV